MPSLRAGISFEAVDCKWLERAVDSATAFDAKKNRYFSTVTGNSCTASTCLAQQIAREEGGDKSPPVRTDPPKTLHGGPELLACSPIPSASSLAHSSSTSSSSSIESIAMPPMLNSSSIHAHMSPPSSPRVRKLIAVDLNAGSRDLSQRDLGRVILDTLQQRVTIASLRSLFSCAGIGETEPFNVPPQHRMLARMKTNGNYFLTNYLLLTVGVFAFLLMFFHPVQLLVCVVVAYGWHVFLTKKEIPTDKLEIFGRRLSEQDILLAGTGSTMVFLLFFVLPTVIFALSVSSLASTAHALLRNNRLKDDSFDSRQSSATSPEVEELV